MTPEEYQHSQAALAQSVLLLTRRQWDRMDSLDDWPEIEQRVTVLTAAGQKQAAERAITYTASTLGVEPVVNPAPLVGVANDARPLNTLLYSSVVTARTTYTATADQLERGRQALAMLVHTVVADAGRAAGGVQITATKNAGYIRAVSPPCCQRCAVLAGKWSRWSEAFERHPQCDCQNIPSLDGASQDWSSQLELDDIKDLTQAQREAVEDGADLMQVINAKRRSTADGMWTSEGVTKRGQYVKAWQDYIRLNPGFQSRYWLPEVPLPKGVRRQLAPSRPTPERIYRLASARPEHLRREIPDRQYAQAMLARYGYIRRTTPLYRQALEWMT